MFQGFVQLEDTVSLLALGTTSARAPVNLDALPTYRVYSEDGLVSGQTGSLAFRDTGTVTGATNASPVVVTSNAHGLTVGTRVTVTGVLGNTGANGTYTISAATSNTFTMTGAAGNGAYTSGGTWNVTGLYKLDLTVSAANGYEAGQTYTVLVTGAISSTAWAETITFGAV